MSATASVNGRPRKQLADQLDRLDDQLQRQDSILDALAEGLNGAVAEAAREGVKEAVKAAVIELLTDPELRSTLHRASAPAAEKPPSAWARFKAKVRKAAARTTDAVTSIASGVAAQVTAAKVAVAGTAGGAKLAWRLKRVLLVAAGFGLLVAAVSFVTTHGVAAVLSGLGATVTALAVQAGLVVRQAARRLKLA